MRGSDARKNAELTPAPVLPPGPEYTEQHLDVDQVLKDELVRLRPDFKPSPIEPGSPQTKEDVSPALARDLFGQNLTALCFSGGGIRSASFCLGILQALAQRKLLSRFDYLSTVSGGGYIGSWLSAWRSRPEQNIAIVEESLVQYPEPKEITTLREFTSYMTPSRGLMSSDTWAGVATIIRNLALNWTLFLPLALLLVLIPKGTVVLFELLRNWQEAGGAGAIPNAIVVVYEWLRPMLVERSDGKPLLDSPAALLLTALAAVFYIWSELFISRQMLITEQPPKKEQRDNSDKPPTYGAGQEGYVFVALIPAYIAACIGSVLVKPLPAKEECWAFVSQFWMHFAVVGAFLWGFPFFLACVWARCKAPPESPSAISWYARWKRRLRFLWLVLAHALSGAGFGIVMVLAVALLRYLAGHYDDRYVVVFGISGFFLAHLAGGILFAGLSTFVRDFDAVREWTARAGGWFLVSGLIWTVYASLVLWELPEGWRGRLVHLIIASGGTHRRYSCRPVRPQSVHAC